MTRAGLSVSVLNGFILPWKYKATRFSSIERDVEADCQIFVMK